MAKKSKCNLCDSNPQGVCLLAGKEIPLCYTLDTVRDAPSWCPKINK